MTLDEIKQTMSAGDTAKAAESLKEMLANEPDNLQAKMLYGTCCQLLGDEETFKRIHDELAPEMEKLEKVEPQTETVSLWKKYNMQWEYLIMAAMVIGAMAVGFSYLKRRMSEEMAIATRALYGGPGYVERQKEYQPITGNKTFIQPSHEDMTRVE